VKKKEKVLLIFLIFFGVFLQSSIMFRSGLNYKFGLGFWGPNGFDGVWHLSLAGQVLKGFPTPFPNFAGEYVKNYHLFFDYLLAISNKISFIPIKYLYFQFFPVLFSLLIGLLSFTFGYCWKKNFWVGFWFAFLNYFAGSFGFLVTLFREGKIGGESLFWSMQSISTLINPPFALSLIFLLSGMILLINIKKNNFRFIFIGILFGLLISIKSYSGIIALGALFFLALIKFFKKEKVYIFSLIISIIISFIVFSPFNSGAKSFFIFKPFWFIHSMIESSDRLFLPNIALIRYSLIDQGIGPRLVLVELIGFLFFIFGNLGTRSLGFFSILKSRKKMEAIDLFIIFGMIISLTIPIFFIQKGTAWNTIQFFYYFLFFSNIYFSRFISSVFEMKKLKISIVVILTIILLTIPTTISTLKNYWGWPPPAMISKKEDEALKFLKKQSDGIVLTFPFLATNYLGETPVPIKYYALTSYVSAFSGKQTFLEKANLDIVGINSSARENEIINFFSSNDINYKKEVLAKNKIKYIYLTKIDGVKTDGLDTFTKNIFENNEVYIYQVN